MLSIHRTDCAGEVCVDGAMVRKSQWCCIVCRLPKVVSFAEYAVTPGWDAVLFTAKPIQLERIHAKLKSQNTEIIELTRCRNSRCLHHTYKWAERRYVLQSNA